MRTIDSSVSRRCANTWRSRRGWSASKASWSQPSTLTMSRRRTRFLVVGRFLRWSPPVLLRKGVARTPSHRWVGALQSSASGGGPVRRRPRARSIRCSSVNCSSAAAVSPEGSRPLKSLSLRVGIAVRRPVCVQVSIGCRTSAAPSRNPLCLRACACGRSRRRLMISRHHAGYARLLRDEH
jgi:hypothetical protein